MRNAISQTQKETMGFLNVHKSQVVKRTAQNWKRIRTLLKLKKKINNNVQLYLINAVT